MSKEIKEERLDQPIIQKKKKGHEGHHGGAWKVAYADFVTAMMALFIVLWIMSQGQQVREAVAAYFKDPGVFTSGKYGGIQKGQTGLLPGKDSKPPSKTDVEKLKSIGAKLEQTISSIPSFEKFKDKIQIHMTKEGLRIELMENSEGLFFDVGSARVKSEALKLLVTMAKELSQIPNKIIIEGHTDVRPYITGSYSNWELSADRANAARKILEENGISKERVTEIRGYADRKLKYPERPYDYSNRRVSIVVVASEKELSQGHNP